MFKRLALSSLFAAAAFACGATVSADDPACAVNSASVPVMFGDMGMVDFGPGFTGSVGTSNLGLRYNFLLLGNYLWEMDGTLNLAWPPAINVTAVGNPNGGSLTLDYGLRLQFWFELLGMEIMLPVPVEVGVDRSEIGMSTFTPWAWDGAGTAVTVTASERLLYGNSVTVLGSTVNYDIYGAYQLTTTVASHDISFPQAMSEITATMPTAMISPTANGDMNLPARWEGALHYVGSLQLRVVLTFPSPLCLPGTPICVSGTQTLIPPALPFASATDQQVSADRNVQVPLPGFQAPMSVDFGTIQLGLTGRQDLSLLNSGSVTTLVTPSTPTDAHFTVDTSPMCVLGGATRTLTVHFVPDAAGSYAADMLLTAVDPSVPSVTVHMTAVVTDGSNPLDGLDGGVDGGTVSTPDGSVTTVTDASRPDDVARLLDDSNPGCGCVAGTRPTERTALATFALMGLAMRRRRRSR